MANHKYKLILNLISLSILVLLIYIYYKSEIVWLGKKNDEYFKYYIILFLFLTFNNIILFFNDRIKLNYVLTLTSIVIILYILELLVSFNKKLFLDPLNFKDKDNKVEFSPFKFFKDSENKNIFPVFSPSNFLNNKDNKNTDNLFPLGGLSKKNTVFCNESNKIEYYFSDRYGFNNDDNIWDEDIEILFIGDSFTQGVCVNRNNNIPSNISNTLDKKILNLGYGGNGPLIEYATLKEYGSSYKPKKVFWLYFEGNDLEELFDEINNPILKKYYNKNFLQNLILKQNKIDKKIINFLNHKVVTTDYNITKQNKLLEVLKLQNLRILANFNRKFLKKNKFQGIITQFEKIMFMAKDEVKKWNGELIFVYLPDYSRYANGDGEKFKKEKILNIITNLNIKTIDIDSLIFQDKSDPLNYFPNRLNNHYNKAGYKVIAEEIIKTLIN